MTCRPQKADLRSPGFTDDSRSQLAAALNPFFKGKELLLSVLVQVEVYYSRDKEFQIIFCDCDVQGSMEAPLLLLVQ